MSPKRSTVKAPGVLTFSVLLILAAFDAPAQEDGGSRHTVVFHSAREDHANNQIYMMSGDKMTAHTVSMHSAMMKHDGMKKSDMKEEKK